ncbi:hypothetical protein D3C74_91330 [compost metagenome]
MIAEELLKNTTNIYLKEFIQVYIKQINHLEQGTYDKDSIEYEFETLLRFHSCITFIDNVQFNITGWQLNDIPIYYSHCFYNENTKESFDLAVWEIGQAIPVFINSDANEEETDTIQNAINNYC